MYLEHGVLHVVLSLQLLDLDDALAFLGLQLDHLLVFLLPETTELLAVRLQLLHQLHALLLHLLSRDRNTHIDLCVTHHVTRHQTRLTRHLRPGQCVYAIDTMTSFK